MNRVDARVLVNDLCLKDQAKVNKEKSEYDALEAVDKEIADQLTEEEQNTIDKQKIGLRQRMAQLELDYANRQKLLAQCDDPEMYSCCERLWALGFVASGVIVEWTAERKALLEKVDALEISDGAKKRLLDLRWK